jgi:hypothetical protein
MGKQIRNPLTILHVRLSSGYRFDMSGIDQQDSEASLQKVEHGPPVDTGTFHCHMSHLMGLQPIMQNHQVRGHRQESPNLFKNLASFPNQEAGHHGFLVNVQTTTAFVNDFHPSLLSPLSPEDVFSRKNLGGVLPDQAGATARGALRHPGPITFGLNRTKYKPTFCHGDNLRKYNNNFHGLWVSQAAMGDYLENSLQIPPTPL